MEAQPFGRAGIQGGAVVLYRSQTLDSCFLADCFALGFLRHLPVLKLLLPCAGWDAPCQALLSAGVKHIVVGAFDTSLSAGEVLRRVHPDSKKNIHSGKAGDVTKVPCSARRGGHQSLQFAV